MELARQREAMGSTTARQPTQAVSASPTEEPIMKRGEADMVTRKHAPWRGPGLESGSMANLR
jgi:hypothetical protein